jgi:predicted CXXCH cytochrome family protein
MKRRHALRALLAFGLAFGLALAVASIAYASTESTYAAWDPSGANAGTLPTPHRDYTTTTTKCAVCHAVHKAPAGGELLLRTTVDQACVYCHIENDIGGVIYDGNTDNYTIENDHGHKNTATGGVTCVDCHAVHGANTFGGAKATEILKVWNIQQTLVAYMAAENTAAVVNAVTGDSWPGEWETSQVQDAAFCTQCHPYFSQKSETTVTASVVQSDGSRLISTFKTHPLKKPGGENGNAYYQGFVAQGQSIPETTTIAVYSARGCNWNCHWSKAGGYPHYNSATSRFLVGGEWDNAQSTVEDPSEDGACLWCHRYADRTGDPLIVPEGTGGVGISY